MTASGTFGYGLEYSPRSHLSDLGAIVSKGTTLLPRVGNEPLRLIETAAGMLNSIGLQNIGIDAVIRDKAPTWARLPVPVLVNISGSTVEEYGTLALRVDGVPGIAGIEVNVSCPNVKEGGISFGIDAEMVREVTQAVRAATDLPLIVKLSPNVTDITAPARAAVEGGADAVGVANTVHGMSIDTNRRKPALAAGSGGLSGPAVKPYALYLVYRVAQEVDVPIVAYGGITSFRDALEFILGGATAVGLGTALLLDPGCWRDVVRDLETWCRREGVRDLAQLVGVANPGFAGAKK